MPTRYTRRMTRLAALTLCLANGSALAEGSRSLYPSDYPSAGARANLDLQTSQRYMDRVIRRGFNYVYAEAGEFITLGSSNRGSGGDILVYNPQGFGVRGDENLPADADFSCSSGSSAPGTHYAGGSLGVIGSRSAELAGPNSPDNSQTVPGGWAPCAYQAPQTGIYGVAFTTGSGGNPNGRISAVSSSGNSVAAWEVTVRGGAGSIIDLDGRLFTYAFVGYTGGNNRPVFSTLYYVTNDGYRYRQNLRGLDPNGYALYANTFGFFDDNAPLYKTLRGNNALVNNLPQGVSAQPAEFPIFFSDISPGGEAETEATKVLGALGIPLSPPSPRISNVAFSGTLGDSTTSTGAGGSFSFDTTDTVSYEVVISRDGIDFDGANPLNRVLTGIAYAGAHIVQWDGLDNSLEPFPARPEPYAYRANGRNGEVHFPIIDAENNGIPANPDVPGGGPTIVRLNGTNPGDTTVFFDDRGYVTRSGDGVGILNGFLCGTAAPAAAAPAVSLNGVDSSTSYRLWENGRNRNRDCAADAGWGDAKGVNLWTYFLTAEVRESLVVVATSVDVATTVSTVDTAEPGDTVQAAFGFANNGAVTATGILYSMSLDPNLTNVGFGGLPPGVSASYAPATGEVTLGGLPASLAPNERINGMTVTYRAPAAGQVNVQTGISTSDTDEVPANNTALAVTSVGVVDVATQITGIPAAADPGSTVAGSVLFSNVGTSDATGVSYLVTFGSAGNAPTSLTFTDLPVGVSANYNPVTGEVDLTGMPALLSNGVVLSVSFSYPAPLTEGGLITVSSQITSASGDANPGNNEDAVSTGFEFPADAAISIDAEALCIRDAPYISYSVTPENFTPNNLATISFIGSDSRVVQTLTDQPLSGLLLWPEAAVGDGGEGVAWPGWELQAGVWVAVPSLVRPAMTVSVSVNPTAEVTLTYPPGSPDCAIDPPGTSAASSPPTAIPTLPWPMLLLTGLGVIGAATRRKPRGSPDLLP